MAKKTSNLDYTPANVNEMGINQLAPILNQLVEQATGVTGIVPTNEAEFVSVAQTALLCGYDPMTQAISQMISRTIFSIRPYNAKFGGINVDNEVYGNHVRKLQTVDKKMENDDRLTLIDGESIDMYRVNKPEVIQTNWYGENQYQKSLTIYRDQLDTAFRSSSEFGRFLSMVMQNALDQITQAKEERSRMTLANLMGAVYSTGNDEQVVKVLSAYNAFAGVELTAETVFNPENFPNFVRWLYGYIQVISDYLTERSAMYHRTIGGKTVMRHTPKNDQRLYIFSPIARLMETIVSSVTYHDENMVFPSYEGVNYWQSIKSPQEIDVEPAIITDDGIAGIGDEVNVKNVIGVLFDREACGITTVNEWAAATPFNARGGYYNQYWHFTERYWNDFSENAVLFVLE